MLNNVPIPYREAQGNSKKHTNFLWVGNARKYVAQKRLALYSVQSQVGKFEGTAHLGDLDINGTEGH